MCGIAVPTGTRFDGLPASVTLLAASGRDGLTAMFARDLHQASGPTLGATGWSQPRLTPSISAPADEDLIDIIVVGAHLSGMPLNHPLIDLGAKFSRVAYTSGAYRLYALPASVPLEPGMIGVGEGEGSEMEVWKLPLAAFGFVAAIPAPLSIGTVMLSDGTSAKGFLAEPLALKGASDKTNQGGWRAYFRKISPSQWISNAV